jgi:hypothetical protein
MSPVSCSSHLRSTDTGLGTLLRAQPLSCSSLEGAVGDGSTGAEQSGRPANVWVRDFCAAITTYAESTNAREDDLETAIARASLGSNLHLTDLCRLIVDAANDELALTTEAGKAIRAAGHPAVENGAEISSLGTTFLSGRRTCGLATEMKHAVYRWTTQSHLGSSSTSFPSRFRTPGARSPILRSSPGKFPLSCKMPSPPNPHAKRSPRCSPHGPFVARLLGQKA